MSKLSNLKAQMGRSVGITAVASPEPAAVEEAPRPTRAAVPPSRVGKVHIGAYLSPDFKRSIMLVRAATGQTETQLLADALNDLFRAHNVPVIDAD